MKAYKLYKKAMLTLEQLSNELDMDNMDGIIKVKKAIKVLETIN